MARRQEAFGLGFEPTRNWDLVLVKGMFILQKPEMLPSVYDELARMRGRRLLACACYNAARVMVGYRSHNWAIE